MGDEVEEECKNFVRIVAHRMIPKWEHATTGCFLLLCLVDALGFLSREADFWNSVPKVYFGAPDPRSRDPLIGEKSKSSNHAEIDAIGKSIKRA